MQRMVFDTLPPNVKLTGDAQEKIVNFQPFLWGFKIFHNLDPYFVWGFQLQIFFFIFLPVKHWIRIRIAIQPKMPDPDPVEMNVDP